MKKVSFFSECVEVGDARPLRQGDVVRCVEASPDPWEDTAVIVTADCDIARDKHAGRLSCVPVVPVRFYLAQYFMPRRISKLLDSLAERFVATVHKAQQANLHEFPTPVRPERLRQWVLEKASQQIAETLRMDPESGASFTVLADGYVHAQRASGKSFSDQVAAIANAEVVLGRARDQDHAVARLNSDLISHLRDLPGDAMYLHSLGPASGEGHIAYLRILREIRDSAIAVRPSRRSFEIKYERIARLQPPYVYALTQQLASVFSAIGLPTEYESARAADGASLALGEVGE